MLRCAEVRATVLRCAVFAVLRLYLQLRSSGVLRGYAVMHCGGGHSHVRAGHVCGHAAHLVWRSTRSLIDIFVKPPSMHPAGSSKAGVAEVALSSFQNARKPIACWVAVKDSVAVMMTASACTDPVGGYGIQCSIRPLLRTALACHAVCEDRSWFEVATRSTQVCAACTVACCTLAAHVSPLQLPSRLLQPHSSNAEGVGGI
jgi:hypothetical protein